MNLALQLGAVGLLALTAAGCNVAASGLNAEGARHFQAGQHQVAIDRFQRAINTDPHNSDGYYNLGAVSHHLGKVNRDSKSYAQAEHYYQQAIGLDPNHAESYRGLAVLLAEQQRTEESVKLLVDWSHRSPTSADARVELARIYQELGNLPEAEKQLVDAVTIDTHHARARAALGMLREQQGDKVQAIVNYNASLEADSVQPQVAARVAALTASMPAGSLPPITTSRMASVPTFTSIR